MIKSSFLAALATNIYRVSCKIRCFYAHFLKDFTVTYEMGIFLFLAIFLQFKEDR
jgi:hypothetical protein